MDLKERLPVFPTLETGRLVLRRLQEEDAPALYGYYHNKNVTRYLDWDGPDSMDMAKKAIAVWNRGFEEGWILRFGIVPKETGLVAGTIFLNGFEGKRAEIGYELSESEWRKGIMGEAMEAVLTLGFGTLAFTRIQAFVREENTASRRLLEKKGFVREGLARQYECHHVTGVCHDMYMYALLAEDFGRAGA